MKLSGKLFFFYHGMKRLLLYYAFKIFLAGLVK